MLRLFLFCAIATLVIVRASDSSCAEDDDGIPTSKPSAAKKDDAILAKQLVRPIKQNDVVRVVPRFKRLWSDIVRSNIPSDGL
ncbi:hypothetical protein Aduo_006556 [Ancylostoma duodenale]